jgi:hypothetical protein
MVDIDIPYKNIVPNNILGMVYAGRMQLKVALWALETRERAYIQSINAMNYLDDTLWKNYKETQRVIGELKIILSPPPRKQQRNCSHQNPPQPRLPRT